VVLHLPAQRRAPAANQKQAFELHRDTIAHRLAQVVSKVDGRGAVQATVKAVADDANRCAAVDRACAQQGVPPQEQA
jgi:hypothetical protein